MRKTSVKRTLTAPDTITKINVTAFAVNRQHGLTLTKYPTQLNVTKALFATMFLPKRAVRGEVICFNAIAHNTDSNKTHNVTMKLAKSSDYSVVTVTKDANGANKEDYSQASVSKELHLPVDGMKAVTFCVRFENIGDIKVRVAVKGVIANWDDVEKTINIKPEGIERSWSYPVLIELTGDKQTFQKTFDVTLPDKVIANSYTVTFSASGDVLGNAAANLGELLKRPYGSGAQNMIHMAPNVYVLTYLMATNRVGKLGPKARNIMQAGYNQQMVFQRYDGSFSAFGNWDRYGSTWLSAFVLKVFAQASTLAGYGLTVEPDMMQRAVGFVTEQQNMDGTFRETGAKIHKKLQGSTEENKLRLTAFTLIALIESGKFFMDPAMFVAANRVAEARTKSKVYLEGKMYKLTGQDPYSTCIATYALALAGSNKTDSAIERMKSIATTVGTDTMYWTVPGATQEEVVEMTGYGLLALMKKNDLASAIKVFRWLNQQQGRFGGFHSTQATVIALQALSRMTHLAMQSNAADVEVKVKVTKYQDDQVSQEAKVAIKAKTAVAVVSADSFQWPSQHRPGKVTVTASSSVPAGKRVFVMAQVTVDYSVHQVPSNGLYATFQITSYTAHSFYMQTCVGRYFTADHDPLYVAEYSIPTGFSIDRKLSRYGMVSKAVMSKGKLITYHRGIYFVKHLLDKYKHYSCSYLRLAMNKGRVAHVRPPVVRVYNAENPKEEIAVGCTLPDSGVCDICHLLPFSVPFSPSVSPSVSPFSPSVSPSVSPSPLQCPRKCPLLHFSVPFSPAVSPSPLQCPRQCPLLPFSVPDSVPFFHSVSSSPLQCPLVPFSVPLSPSVSPCPLQCPLLPLQCPLVPFSVPFSPSVSPSVSLSPLQCPLVPFSVPFSPFSVPLSPSVFPSPLQCPLQCPLSPLQCPLLCPFLHFSVPFSPAVSPSPLQCPCQCPLLPFSVPVSVLFSHSVSPSPLQCPLLPLSVPLSPSVSPCPLQCPLVLFSVPCSPSVSPCRLQCSLLPFSVPFSVPLSPSMSPAPLQCPLSPLVSPSSLQCPLVPFSVFFSVPFSPSVTPSPLQCPLVPFSVPFSVPFPHSMSPAPLQCPLSSPVSPFLSNCAALWRYALVSIED
ncbi:hypothetical protein ACOMHN_014366 [Nucella lapillus]